MAKKIKGGSVEVTVTDKGSLKRLGRNARRTAKDMGSVAKSTAESDRRLKSLSGQTSNSSKAFSKQAQTISGGLVPIYATLAAQVFAVSAAYRFMSESANFKNLLDGQLAYGTLTGNMYSVLATDIRDATKAQISFSEASQAAAIGSAAGLSGEQLERLSAAALNTSVALGRDLTDSFNRLVRGVTKAEPELLDELGIILRLDPALRNYATAIRKTKEQLNPFERSQAVTNEVLAQAESKFGAIGDLMPKSAFAVQQFGQAFTEVLEDVKVIIANIGAVALPFFTQNVTALIGALSAFSLGIIKTMLPNFEAVAEQARVKRKELQAELKIINAEMATLQAGGAIKTKADARGIRKTSAADIQKFRPDLNVKKLSDRQVTSLLAQANRGRIKMTAQMKGNEQAYKASLERMAAANKRLQGKQVLDVQTAEQKKRQEFLKTEQAAIASEEKRANKSMSLNKIVSKSFNALMFASLAVMGLDLVKSGLRRATMGKEGLDDFTEANRELDASVSRLEKINKQLVDMDKRSDRVVSSFTQLSNALRSIKMEEDAFNVMNQDLDKLIAHTKSSAIGDIFLGQGLGISSFFSDQIMGFFDFSGDAEQGAKLKEQRQEFLDQLTNLKRLATPALNKAIENIEAAIAGKDRSGLENAISNFEQLRDEYNKLTASAKGLTEAQKTLNTSITGFVNKFAPKEAGREMRTALTAAVLATTHTGKVLQQDIDAIGGQREVEFVAMFGDNKQAKNILERQKALKEQVSLNNAIKGILDQHIDQQNTLNLAVNKTKVKKSEIVKDESALSAQLKRQVAEEEASNKLANHKLQISITEGLLAKEEIVARKDIADALNAGLKNMKEQQTVLENQLETTKNIEKIRRDGLQNKLATRAETTDPFSLSHMFGMTKPITENDIENTMDKNPGMTRPEAIENLKAFNTELTLSETKLKMVEGLSTSIGTTLMDGFANAFVEVAKGTTTFADAFRNMAIKILADIASMTMRMLILNTLFPGGGSVDPLRNMLGTRVENPFGAPTGPMGRTGGVMSSPGYRSYARGGVAMGPDSGYAATLHGTEAVVPLGNSRSIPVELKGAGGGVNNITVNVNGGTQSSGQNPQQGKALGDMIQAATMEIIQREKRPGGVLSR